MKYKNLVHTQAQRQISKNGVSKFFAHVSIFYKVYQFYKECPAGIISKKGQLKTIIKQATFTLFNFISNIRC